MTPEIWKAYANGGKIKEEVDDILTPTLRKGDRNHYVQEWQERLNKNGYCCGNADGIFGDKTEKAVIKYQQDHGMEAGYIGSQTWATLL